MTPEPEVLRVALEQSDVEVADGPYFDMLGNVKVRFTPEGAQRLAEIIDRAQR